MDHPNYNIEHKKGKHLTYEERVIIQIRLKDGWSTYQIAKAIGCTPNTVRNEINRGLVPLYHGKHYRYKADAGQLAYKEHRQHSRKCYSRLAKSKFVEYVVTHFKEDGWSLDACHGHALVSGEFGTDQTVCTKTLYNYADLGLISIKNIDLPLKLHRNTRNKRVRQNKKDLGRSIEERPKEIENREEFGHWEADLVIGQKSGEDKVLLTLAERKSRQFFIRQIAGKTARAVMEEFKSICTEYGNMFSRVFKTITTDNGSEFAQLQELETISATMIYFARPFSSWEKGTNEMHNGLIRRFIPKGRRINEYSFDEIVEIEDWCNLLPRKILTHRTLDEVFNDELDKIYAA